MIAFRIFSFACFQLLISVCLATEKRPVVVVTDLYHPYQDPGDNLDLINAYALPSLDLKAILLDCHEPFFHQVAKGVGTGLFIDKNGPREPGFICIEQLNRIFDRTVKYGIGPWFPMRSKDDKMEDVPLFQQSALSLLKETLENATEKITIVSFGSLRILALANNRFPDLMRKRIKEIHISAGTSNNNLDIQEWNVALDTNAFVSILESKLPLVLYPCAAGNINEKDQGKHNAFVGDNGNTYFYLENLSFINSLDDSFKNYVSFVLNRDMRLDYLHFLTAPFEGDSLLFNRGHHIWEMSVWMQVADLRLVKTKSNDIEIISAEKVKEEDEVFQEELIKSYILVNSGRGFRSRPAKRSNFSIYQRGNPEQFNKWMNVALPKFYKQILSSTH